MEDYLEFCKWLKIYCPEENALEQIPDDIAVNFLRLVREFVNNTDNVYYVAYMELHREYESICEQLSIIEEKIVNLYDPELIEMCFNGKSKRIERELEELREEEETIRRLIAD